VTKKSFKYEINDKDLNFDFDEWAALYKDDPEAFEDRCQQWNEQLVDSAPISYQRRLSGLLFQINMEKKRSSNAIDSCLRISGLMWGKFHELNIELNGLIDKSQDPSNSFPKSKMTDKPEDIDLVKADIIDIAAYQKA